MAVLGFKGKKLKKPVTQSGLSVSNTIKNNTGLSQVSAASQNAATIPKPSNWMGTGAKVMSGDAISSVPTATPAPTAPTYNNPFFDTYKTDTFKRLGIADEAEFNAITGLNFTDQYYSEFNNAHSRGQSTQPLDSLIGESFRAQRDAGSQINQLTGQLNSTTDSLSGGQEYLGLQELVDNAIKGGATDVNSISQATGLNANLINAIQQGNIEGFNAEIGNLQTQINGFGETASSITRNAEIARKLGISEDLVKKITSGDATNLGVNSQIKAQLSKDAETGLTRLEEDKNIAKERAAERLKEYEAKFLIDLDNQKARNAIIEGNMSRLAGITGAGFSSRGIGGMEEVTRQSLGIIQEMQTLYDQSVASVGDYLEDIELNYIRGKEDIQGRLEDSINNVTNGFLANIASIKSKFGEVSDEAIERLNDASATYLENIIDVEQQGFDNMVTINEQMRANMASAREMVTFKNEEAARIATQLINTGASMTDVLAMVQAGEMSPEQAREVQSQMVANTMATLQAIPGAEGIAPQYSQEIINGINEGKTPFEILDEVTSDPKFIKAREEAGLTPLSRAQLERTLLENQELRNDLKGTLPGGLPDSSEIVSNSQEKRGKVLLQCGELVNDYWQQVTGSRAGVGDTYESKVAAITKVGESDTPQEGGLFAYSTGVGNPGHVGIVQAVNEDGSIEVLEANKEGAMEGGLPVEATYGADMVQKMVFSQAPVSVNADIETLIETDPNYQLANNILEGFGSYPSKTSKNYEKVVNAVAEVSEYKANSTDDPNLKKIYESAKYDKEVAETTAIKLTDAFTVLSSVSNLTTQLEDMEDDIGPLEGLLRKKNPYDVDAQAVAAQLNALVPKVAKGVFGEVGVLTDQDIERYMKTLPNTKMTGELATVVGDLLKITVTKSLINTITTQAKAQRNVINFATDYEFAKEYLASKGVSADPRASYVDQGGGDKIVVGDFEFDMEELDAVVSSGFSNDEVKTDR